MMNEKNEKELGKISAALPELNDSDRKIATSEESASWARDTTKFYNNGYVLPKNHGIGLQVIDEETIRCISVVSDESCLRVLSMVKLTFESVGIEFQIDPFAVFQKVTPRPEDAPPYLIEERKRALGEGVSEEPPESVPGMKGNNVGIEVV